MHLTACGGGQQAGHIYDATKMTTPFCCRSYQSPSQLIPRSVLRIRIHRIYMFLGLQDTDADPLDIGVDPDPVPDPDPSITKQK
jgi:hypothetical protein